MGDPWTIVGWLLVVILSIIIIIWILELVAAWLTY